MVSIAAPGAGARPLTTPHIGIKRKHSDIEDDGQDSPPALTGKRHKVTFSSDVEVKFLEDWTEKGLDLVREEVRHAIQKHFAGDSNDYDHIKQLFTSKPSAEDAPSSRLLRKYVVALMGTVSSLNKRCSGLVQAVLDCQWLGRDETFITLYIRFLSSLVSAHGGHLATVLKMIVSAFTSLPSHSSCQHLDDPPIRRSELLARSHLALKTLLRLIPSASGTLTSVLASMFPFATDTTKAHADYVQNLLNITEYAPELKGSVLALVTERLVKIDVQVQVDMEDLEEDLEEDLVQEAFPKNEAHDDLEDDASDISDNESVMSDESLDDEERRLKEIKKSIAKMDAILDLLFDYYHPIFATGKALDMEDTFEHLLSQFANTILPTYRSRHTQFILFHFGQASPRLIERFAATCANIAFDKSRPQIMRSAAAAYLACFIARGAHVSPKVVRDVFGMLSTQLDSLRKAQEPTCTSPDLRRYGGYYAIAQALLYIFCFRWRDLAADIDEEVDDDDIYEGKDLNWVPGMKEVMTRNIYSKFNPLKVCSPVIVHQFARIAHHLRFLYVFPLLETNKRLRLSRSLALAAAYSAMPARETALSGKRNEADFQLDAYFPFDPYHLPKSKRWIDGDYVEWKSIPGLDDDKDDDESGSGSEVEEDEEEEEIYEEDTETEASA